MLLSDILERLENCPATLTFLSEKGELTQKTFAELYTDTLALLERLKQSGLQAGDRVGLLGPNSYPWMVWDLACLSLGGVSVALPQEKPADAVPALAERYALRLLAVAPEWVPDGTIGQGGLVAINDFAGPAALQSVARPPAEHPAGTLSLVFSSGTTGKTKGLIISRPGTERLLNLYGDAFGVADGERFLTFLPFANYQQRMAYYFCLYHAIDFVYVPYPSLFAGLKRFQPTYVIAPPVFYESLQTLTLAGLGARAKEPDADALIRDRLATLLGGRIRYLITGMAPIKRQILDFFWDHGVRLFEAFGITEAGMVAWNKPGQVKLGTVGQPAEPGSVRLSDEGEVIVTRDALLSFGYFEAADDDAASTFIAPGAVATGDIAEFDGEGYLRIIGRKKDAIITKAGEKFHPEPIEAAIQAQGGVNMAVVLGGDALPGLAAVIALKKSERAAAEVQAEVKAHVRELNSQLPVFQQVKRVVFTDREFTVESGLRTKNLKLARKAIYAAFVDDCLNPAGQI